MFQILFKKLSQLAFFFQKIFQWLLMEFKQVFFFMNFPSSSVGIFSNHSTENIRMNVSGNNFRDSSRKFGKNFSRDSCRNSYKNLAENHTKSRYCTDWYLPKFPLSIPQKCFHVPTRISSKVTLEIFFKSSSRKV